MCKNNINSVILVKENYLVHKTVDYNNSHHYYYLIVTHN